MDVRGIDIDFRISISLPLAMVLEAVGSPYLGRKSLSCLGGFVTNKRITISGGLHSLETLTTIIIVIAMN
jgi:hypothetical protein